MKKIRLTSESWIEQIRAGGGLFHIRMAINIAG